MAIRTMDDLIAGGRNMWMFGPQNVFFGGAGVPQSFWANKSGAYDTTLNGVILNSADSGGYMAGMSFPFFDPTPSPDSAETYLNRWAMCCSGQPCSAVLYDRLWHNGGITITSTSVQNITSPTWPARDANGSTNGVGVILAIEVSAQTGAGSPTITVSYTNSDGTSGRSATWPGSSTWQAGWFVPLILQEDDKGVRSVQSIQLSASWTSGTINLVAARPLAYLELANVGSGVETDFTINGMPQLYNGTVPFITNKTTSSTGTYLITSSLSYFQG